MVADLMPASSPCGLFEILDLVAVLLGPARVHAQQHAGPVLALGAAGAGMDFEIAVVGVGLAREQRFELAPRHLGLQRLERGFGLGDDLLVLFGLAELDHGELVVELALDAADGVELVLERGALLHHALRALRSFQRLGSSACLFSSARRLRALSKSKMPPQQPDRLLDVFDDALGFGAHGSAVLGGEAARGFMAGCGRRNRPQKRPVNYNPPVPERRMVRSASGRPSLPAGGIDNRRPNNCRAARCRA